LICEVMLPPSLANWQQEMEQVGQIAVVLLRVPADGQTTVLNLPPRPPGANSSLPIRASLASFRDIGVRRR
jgi:hypothetical protein